MKVFVKGLNGCGMRKTNLQKYRSFIEANGHELVLNPKKSDVILLWTCAFRKDFRDNSIAEISRYQNEYRNAELIVCGCLPDIDRGLLMKHFSGRVVPWREETVKMKEYFGACGADLNAAVFDLAEKHLCDDVAKFKNENPAKDASFVDQFIKAFVAEGCRFECTYCAERLAFPPYRSYPLEDIVKSCRRLIEETGKKEVMLLGDSLGDYGHDIGKTLPDLISAVLAIDPAVVVALQGFHPAHFLKYYNAMEVFLSRGAIRHMQLPIQSASDRILKLMKRAYDKAGLERMFSMLNRIGFREYDTHLIAGFPGEAEADFEETVAFVLKHRPKYVLMSAFMESPAMEAAALDGKLGTEVVNARLEKAKKKFIAAGIICNANGGALSRQRFFTLNRTGEGD